MNTKQIKPNISGKKVFVGLSGGVDSAVSAALLKEQGFDVTGVFIKVWSPDFLPCTWRDERRDAMRAAAQLDIPFLFFDFEKEYKKEVADYMVNEYKEGRIPNPDVMCNKEIKFGIFWKKAEELGVNFIATGHYAQNIEGKLFESVDKEKDQSYFLWTLTKNDLKHIIFPVGNLNKKEVRRLAEKYKLSVSTKKDSQGICFLGEISLEEFLPHFIQVRPGNVLDTQGNIIGTHKGAIYFTLGERHGFDVTTKGPDNKAYYVVSKNMNDNTITVSNDEKVISELSAKKVLLKEINFNGETKAQNLLARVRYRGEKIQVKFNDDKVEFISRINGVAVGQSLVLYDGDFCVGGGIIDEIIE
ncbi:MAG: tRNA 2-thiouridine(34) synthase MnmA [Minisyncoccia bacterium]